LVFIRVSQVHRHTIYSAYRDVSIYMTVTEAVLRGIVPGERTSAMLSSRRSALGRGGIWLQRRMSGAST
jgi:hypothetical protein